MPGTFNMWSVFVCSPAPPKCKGGIFINVSSFYAMNSYVLVSDRRLQNNRLDIHRSLRKTAELTFPSTDEF